MPSLRRFFALAAVLLAGCTAGAQPTPGLETPVAGAPSVAPSSSSATPSPALAVEPVCAIYAAGLTAVLGPGEIDQAVAREQTVLGAQPGQSLDTALSYVQKQLVPPLAPETISDFRVQNAEAQPLAACPPETLALRVIGEAEYGELFQTQAGWAELAARYPGATSIVTFSRVGFSPDQNQALLYLGVEGQRGSGQGLYLLLSRAGGGWQVERSLVAWVA